MFHLFKDARARYAILKRRHDDAPVSDAERGRASKTVQMDHAFKAEETNTGRCAPTPLRSIFRNECFVRAADE